MRFVESVIQGSIILTNRKKNELLLELKTKGFKSFQEKKTFDDDMFDEQDRTNESLEKGFDYLLSMKLWSLTIEKVNELSIQRDAKRAELDSLASKSAETLWVEDLTSLENALFDFEAALEETQRSELESQQRTRKSVNSVASRRKTGPKPKKVVKKKPKHGADDDEASSENLSSSSDDDDDDVMDDSDYNDATPVKVKPRVKPITPSPTSSKPKHSLNPVQTMTTNTAPITKSTVPTTSVAHQKSLLAFFPSSSTALPNSSSLVEPTSSLDPIDISESPAPIKKQVKNSGKKSASKTTTPSNASKASSTAKKGTRTKSSKKKGNYEDIEDSDTSDVDFMEDDSDYEESGTSSSRKRTYSARKAPLSAISRASNSAPSKATPNVKVKTAATSSTKKTAKKVKVDDDEAIDLVDSESEPTNDDDSDYEEVKSKVRRRSSNANSVEKKLVEKKSTEELEIISPPLSFIPSTGSAMKTPLASSASLTEETPPSLMERLKARRLSGTPIVNPKAT